VSGSLALAREKCVNGRTHMMAQRRKPIALRQFNPKFEDKCVPARTFSRPIVGFHIVHVSALSLCLMCVPITC
jgi:hypothetical protein